MISQSAALLLQLASLSLLPRPSHTFSGSPPDTCKYQGYTFQILHTHVCLNYRLCYCQATLPDHPSALNPTDPPHPERSEYTELAEYETETPPLLSGTPRLEQRLRDVMFMEWRPKPADCACWCSGISYETREDVLYKPDDTCIIDESDCYCDLEKDLLWANQMRHIYDD